MRLITYESFDNFCLLQHSQHDGDIASLVAADTIADTAIASGINTVYTDGKLYFNAMDNKRPNSIPRVKGIAPDTLLEFAVSTVSLVEAQYEHPEGELGFVNADILAMNESYPVANRLMLRLLYMGSDMHFWNISILGWHGDHLRSVLLHYPAEAALIAAGYHYQPGKSQFGQTSILVPSRSYEMGGLETDAVTIAQIVMPFVRATTVGFVVEGL